MIDATYSSGKIRDYDFWKWHKSARSMPSPGLFSRARRVIHNYSPLVSRKQSTSLLKATHYQAGFRWPRLSFILLWLYLLPLSSADDINLGTTTTGNTYTGYSSSSYFGSAVDGGGDFNGDGKADIIIGAYGDDQNGGDSGAAYVIFGGFGAANIDFPSFSPGVQGFRIFGHTTSNYLGISVRFAGNFNGDAYGDIIVGSHTYSSTGRSNNGAAYIIFGHGGTFNDIYMSSFASGTAGLKIIGGGNSDQLGASVTGLGDFNGDSLPDVAVGAHVADGSHGSDSGIVYVFYGRSTAIPGDIDCSGFSATSLIGFKINGAMASEYLGYAVSAAGDINVDGKQDLLIGGYNSNLGGGAAGAAYVIYGRTSVSDIALNGLSGNTVGFRIIGAPNMQLGFSVSGAGDFNGDGIADVVVGAYGTDVFRGTSYVIFGKAVGTLGIIPDVNIALFTSGADGYRIYGEAAGDRMGNSVSRVGDVNGDGIVDIAMGAFQATRNGLSSSGVTYVIFGRRSTPTDIFLSTSSVNWGHKYFGAAAAEQSGYAVGPAGDFNQDGIADFLIGANYATIAGNANRGRVNLVFGFLATPTSQPSSRPSGQPSAQPSRQPSGQPSAQPSNQPSRQPSAQPSGQPSRQPSAQPSSQPSAQPSVQPSRQPSGQPSNQPSAQPSGQPSGQPTVQPSAQPSRQPSAQPSNQPSGQPSAQPSRQPSSQPSGQPSTQPSSQPSNQPTCQPTAQPSGQPSCQPSSQPSAQPSGQPSRQPSAQPSGQPSRQPSVQPSSQPSAQPSGQPSAQPSGQPSRQPSAQPSGQPSAQPSNQPTAQPSGQPSGQPSAQPSRQPSKQPTSQPSQQPSGQPSRQPSGQPSTQPTQQPSAQPSRQPSAQPSSQPSSQPSVQPSGQPSIQPTVQPSRQPSAQPSSQPSSQPSVQPSGQPSTQPSVQPSGQPSSRPSMQPSGKPTGQPTMQPSWQPSCQPSAQPSSQPSMQPSYQPSAQPSAQPSSQPSRQPSGQPSGQPSRQPSEQPSSQPSEQPSGQPSAQPSGQPSTKPTAQPSTQPSAQPSSQPSEQPSMQPSDQPTDQPSANPSQQPSSQPSAEPSKQPSSQPTSQPSSQPTRAPSGQPSSQPSCQPTSQPSGRPSTQPSIQPTSQPSTSPTAWYNATLELLNPPSAPLITSIKVNDIERSAVSLTIFNEGRRNVMIYCAAFASLTHQPRSTFEILSQNMLVNSKNGFAHLTVKSLYAATDYSLYCMSVTPRGVQLSLTNALRQVAHVRTLCCKLMTVSLLTSSLFERKSIADSVSVALNGPPSSTLSIDVAFASVSGTPSSMATTSYPSSVVLTPTSNFRTVQFLRLVAGGLDTVQLVVTLSGASADEYALEYAENRRVVNILSIIVEPTLPVLAVARFSDDGSAVALTFDSPTDKARYSNAFSCMSLLSFDGAATAACQWTSSATILVFPKYTGPDSKALAVGSNVTLFADQVRARCVVNDTSACSAWATVPLTRVAVRAPINPTTPVVSFPLPSAVSACNPLVIDLTASSGTAGRPWESLTFKVLTSNGETVAALLLQQYLDANYTYSPPTVVPTDIMAPGFIYSIQATVCNFLGACGTAVRKVTVHQGAVLVPIASINGPKQRDAYRYASLVLNSAAYTESCEGVVSYSNLTRTWTVLAVSADGSTSATSLESFSQDSAVFKLAPYVLTVDALYEVVLTATSMISGVSSSTSAMVTVLPGELIARIAQGTAALVQTGTTVSLDASGSYDQDVELLTGWNAGLSFQWSCEQLEPIFNPDCSISVASELSEHGDINTVAVKSDAALNSVLLFTVTVTTADASRSSRAFIDITITAAAQADLRITNTASSITSVDAGSALTLRGLIKVSAPCTAMWTVDDPFVNLASVSRTPLVKSIAPSSGLSMLPFNLVIEGGTLTQRATFAFSLQCGDSRSTVTVTTNGAPLPGVFTVSPATGEELSTLFTFTAVQWSDPDLPLLYQFSYAVPGGASSLALGSATEKSYTESSLPAGALNCTMAVYDSFGAAAVEVRNITVTSIVPEDRSAALSALLHSTTGSVDDTKRVLSVASAALSQSNCSTVDVNCTAFSADDREFRLTLLSTLESLTAREDVNKLSVQDWSSTLQTLTAISPELAEGDINKMIHIANHTILSALAVGSTNYNGLLGVLQAIDAAVTAQKPQAVLNSTTVVPINSTASNVTGLVYTNISDFEFAPTANASNTAITLVSIAGTFADVVTNAQAFGEAAIEFLYDNFRMSAGLYELSADAASLTLQSPQSEADRFLGKSASTATLKPTSTSTGADSIVAVKVLDIPSENYPTDPNAFLSNPLYLQVTAQNGQSPLDMVSELDFTFQHLGSVAEFEARYDVNFTSICLGLSWTESYAFVCPGSGVVLNNTCSNGLGEYTLFCPKLTPGCAQLGLYSAEVDILNTCNVTDYSSTHTTCRCSVSAAIDPQTRRPLSFRRRLAADTVENQAMDETGVTSMMATSHYVLMEFADTFNAADKFNDPAMVAIVIYMFATVWGVGLLILSVCLTKGYISKREKMKQMSNKVAVATATLQGSSSSASDVAQAKRVLLDYIDGVFPSVYDDTKSSFGRMLGELRAHHRYMTVFTLNDGQISLQGKMLVIGKILTVETMQMFVLAMLYDLQGPENDNSCGQFANEEACHTRKSLFDSAQSYCEWNNQPSPGQDNCMYREEQFSFKISMYILVLTSIFSSLFATPLDYLFKVCHAPLLENAEQAQVSNRVGGRSSLARGVRRLSAISANAVKAARRTTIAATVEVQNNVKRIKGWFTAAKQSDRVIANREISEDVEHLHLQALTILPSVSVNSDTLLRQKQAAALHMKSRAFSKRGSVIIESGSDQSLQTNSDKDQGEVRAASSANLTTSSKTKESPKARAAVLELCEEIIAQRELMPKDSPFTAEFDSQWGIRTITRPASGCRSGSAVGSYHVTYVISDEARADIYDAIVTSDEQAAELNESMPRYTLQHGGLAVLNLFVLDLLGRTTSAAKIYRNKFEEDFEKTKPVSRWYKALAVAIILGANGFFIFYSLLKAFQKGTTWQYKYLQGCIVQFVVELFLNETIECIWLNFVVPDLVRKEVKKATVVINKVVEQITESANARSGRSILFLDATPYLFSSTKVARAHPSLLESIVVLNYQSHVPGELSKTWPRCIQVATESQRYVDSLANEGKSMWERVYSALPVAILAVSTFLVLTLQGLGTMSFRVQRVVLRFVQPAVLSGLTLMWFFAPSSTTGLFLVTLGSFAVLAAFVWRQYYVHKLERAQKNSTAPGFDDTALFIDLDAEMEDIESVPNSPKRGLSRESSSLSLHKTDSSGNLKNMAGLTSEDKQRRHSMYSDTSSDESTESDPSIQCGGERLGTFSAPGSVVPAQAKRQASESSLEVLDIDEDYAELHSRSSLAVERKASQKASDGDETKVFPLKDKSLDETKDAQGDAYDALVNKKFTRDLSIDCTVAFAKNDFSDDEDALVASKRAASGVPATDHAVPQPCSQASGDSDRQKGASNKDNDAENVVQLSPSAMKPRAKAFSVDYSVAFSNSDISEKEDGPAVKQSSPLPVDNDAVPLPNTLVNKDSDTQASPPESGAPVDASTASRTKAFSVDYAVAFTNSDFSDNEEGQTVTKGASLVAAGTAEGSQLISDADKGTPAPVGSVNIVGVVESATLAGPSEAQRARVFSIDYSVPSTDSDASDNDKAVTRKKQSAAAAPPKTVAAVSQPATSKAVAEAARPVGALIGSSSEHSFPSFDSEDDRNFCASKAAAARPPTQTQSSLRAPRQNAPAADSRQQQPPLPHNKEVAYKRAVSMWNESLSDSISSESFSDND